MCQNSVRGQLHRNTSFEIFLKRFNELSDPLQSAFTWANTKGSDTMLLLRRLRVQLVGFLNDGAHAVH